MENKEYNVNMYKNMMKKVRIRIKKSEKKWKRN